MYVCLGGLCYIFYTTLYFKAGKSAQKCFQEEVKKRFLSGEELNLAGESLSFSTASQSMLAGSSIQKTNP